MQPPHNPPEHNTHSPTPESTAAPQAASSASTPLDIPANGHSSASVNTPAKADMFAGKVAKTTPPFAQKPQGETESKGPRRGALHLPLIAVSLALILLVATTLFSVWGLQDSINSLFGVTTYNNTPPQNSFSIIRVVGSIANSNTNSLGISNPTYNHSSTLSHIRSLAENEDNKGILLYMDTPGGGVYESDEVYLALMEYKEETGRPVWAYMAQTCASGGYYITSAADHISANRISTTGSIGVYIQMTDTSELYDKIGVDTVLIRSGDNKGTGISGLPITSEQQQVYQGIVDEYYERFVDIVADARGMSYEQAEELSDGRVYTSTQALNSGLIDEIGEWEALVEKFEEETGATPFYTNFSRNSTIGQLLSEAGEMLPQGEAQAVLGYMSEVPNGVPMALYVP